MKAQELRLNNLVLCNYKTGLVSVVKWIQENSITVSFKRQNDLMNGACVNPDALQPIPLTEEWLLKFGFEYSKRAELWFFGENPVTKDWMITLKWLEGEDCPFYRNGHFKLKYVHQLQNLYFALTGEELKIEEL